MSWDAYDDGDGSVNSYTVICRAPANPLYFMQTTISGTLTQYTVSGVNPATTYECCITVSTSNGDSPFTCSSATTDEDSKYLTESSSQ